MLRDTRTVPLFLLHSNSPTVSNNSNQLTSTQLFSPNLYRLNDQRFPSRVLFPDGFPLEEEELLNLSPLSTA